MILYKYEQPIAQKAVYVKEIHMKENETNTRLTINDVARELGLSTTTISRAISGKGRISDKTRERVLEYINEHNYRPNIIAKGLADKRTYNICVNIPSDANIDETPFFQCCLMGICEAASSRDYDVVVTTTTDTDITYLKRVINNHKVDGVILTRSLINDIAAKFLKENGISYVLIGDDTDKNVIKIDSDHLSGCAQLTSYMIMSGCRKLAFLCGSHEHIVNRNRYNGFLKGCEQNGMIPSKECIYLDVINDSQVAHSVDKALKSGCDCIICSDDLICTRVLRRLDEINVSVPGDIKVASFYNSSALENHTPPVTALTINVKELGVAAGKTLIEMINGQEVSEMTLIDYEIVLKGSTK